MTYSSVRWVSRTMFSSSAKWPFSIIRSASSMIKKRKRRIPVASFSSWSSASAGVGGTHRFDQIPQSSGGRYENVAPSLDYSFLLLRTETSDHAADADPRRTGRLAVQRMLDDFVQMVDHLQRQFSRRAQDESCQGSSAALASTRGGRGAEEM
jgi:hypothetical protein